MADPLGRDVNIEDPLLRAADGRTLLVQEVEHRLTCEILKCIGGPLIDRDGDEAIAFGIDVRKWSGEVIDEASAALKASAIDEALQRSPRVASVRASVRQEGSGPEPETIIDLSVTSLDGAKIEAIYSVRNATVERLAGG